MTGAKLVDSGRDPNQELLEVISRDVMAGRGEGRPNCMVFTRKGRLHTTFNAVGQIEFLPADKVRPVSANAAKFIENQESEFRAESLPAAAGNNLRATTICTKNPIVAPVGP